MASSARMLAAGVSAIWVLLSLFIYVIIVGPLFNILIPFLHANTPEVYWVMLHGDMIDWLIPFVYILITLCGVFIIVRMFGEAFSVVDYNSGG